MNPDSYKDLNKQGQKNFKAALKFYEDKNYKKCLKKLEDILEVCEKHSETFAFKALCF